MQLYFQRYPEGADLQEDSRPPAIIIPGLFGSTSNWRSLARSMGEHYPVIVIDQRNHGRSPHADSQTYADMAQDLLDFVDHQGFEQCIPCGHSMGGKVAMVFSLLYPERVARLAVLDIAPLPYTHSHAPFLDELMKIDLSSLPSRSAADRALQHAIPDIGTRLFLLQSLTGSPGNYHWRLNLEILHRFMPDIVGFPTDELAGKFSDVTAMFVFGENSDYVRAEHHERCRSYFPNVQFEGIPDAGHWLHIEQPKAVLDTLLHFVQIGEEK